MYTAFIGRFFAQQVNTFVLKNLEKPGFKDERPSNSPRVIFSMAESTVSE